MMHTCNIKWKIERDVLIHLERWNKTQQTYQREMCFKCLSFEQEVIHGNEFIMFGCHIYYSCALFCHKYPKKKILSPILFMLHSRVKKHVLYFIWIFYTSIVRLVTNDSISLRTLFFVLLLHVLTLLDYIYLTLQGACLNWCCLVTNKEFLYVKNTLLLSFF